ncbi:MAG TPA: mannose-1-phosphate guanylyltransferase [Candidatus Binataceae bacterium]|nr:mannose-1-phosphate guanylyltransferase [Candidatus Binataceae bacterium]
MGSRSRRGIPSALIIAGGRGTRFWPESRAERPKPLFSIDGKTTLLDDTIARLQPLVPRDRIFVLASADQAPAFRRAVKDSLPPRNLIVEPEGRGTAVAITYGAAAIASRFGSETVVAVMPADHHIAPAAGFRRTIADAAALASSHDAIVVVGVTPARSETGYGYQKIGKTVGAGFRVERFIEKPPPALAQKMVRSGKFLWNAGMFVMRTETLAAELERHAPELADAMRRFGAIKPSALPSCYRTLQFDSFDRVVAEKSDNVLGVRAQFGWHDVGSWEGLWEALRGKGTNVISGNAIALDSDGVLARAGKRLMVLIGVSDLVAVDTGDAILIAQRSRSQEVRAAIDEMRRRGLDRYL